MFIDDNGLSCFIDDTGVICFIDDNGIELCCLVTPQSGSSTATITRVKRPGWPRYAT